MKANRTTEYPASKIIIALAAACLITGCSSTRRVAEVYATSGPATATVWCVQDGHSFGDTPSSTLLYSHRRCFGLFAPKSLHLKLVFEKAGFHAVVKELKVTNWERGMADAKLNSNKVSANLNPL
ncbi:MAG: hypothetical protein C5B44_06760 [Acidobacteria bacterium]|nr:MAG: hypothetical protein C5B44_06760 [Acidobacteriota bacterium]